MRKLIFASVSLVALSCPAFSSNLLTDEDHQKTITTDLPTTSQNSHNEKKFAQYGGSTGNQIFQQKAEEAITRNINLIKKAYNNSNSDDIFNQITDDLLKTRFEIAKKSKSNSFSKFGEKRENLFQYHYTHYGDDRYETLRKNIHTNTKKDLSAPRTFAEESDPILKSLERTFKTQTENSLTTYKIITALFIQHGGVDDKLLSEGAKNALANSCPEEEISVTTKMKENC